MITEPVSRTQLLNDKKGSNNVDFDTHMAQLLILVTHHSLTNCPNALQPIVERLEFLFHSSELDFFPEQRQVLVKMHKLWLTQQAKQEQTH